MNIQTIKNIGLFLLLTMSFFSNAQTGPGGVGKTDGTSTLNLWLNPDIGIATGVSSWVDQSGYGHDVSQSTTSARPSEQTNTLNGHSVVRFDGNDDYLKHNLSSSTTQDNYTLLFVWKWNNSAKKNESVFVSSDVSDHTNIQFSSNGSNFTYKGTSTSDIVIDPNANFSSYNITTLQRYTGSNFSAWRDGTSIVTNTNNSTWAHTFEVYKFGVNRNDNKYLEYDLGEAVVIYSKINTAERVVIENYLSAKYDITISNDKYAGDGGAEGEYDDNVIGIGTESSGSHTKSNDNKGLTIEQNSGFTNGEYLFAGNNVETNENLYTDISGVTGLKARWKRIWYFDITGSGNETVNITFDISEGGFSGNAGSPVSNYKLLYRSSTSGNWTDAGNASSISGDQITFSNNSLSNGDGYYTIGTLDYDNSPLPIQLLSFDAVKQDLNVLLNWQTATETNNDFFTIERSSDGKDWQALTQVKGAGNSNEIRSYHYSDYSPLAEMSYYRLKQTDYDGSFDYLSVRKVAMQQKAELKVYPNPTQNSITMKGNVQDLQAIQIYNSLGQEFSSKVQFHIIDSASLKIDLSALPRGVYYIRLNDEMLKVFKN